MKTDLLNTTRLPLWLTMVCILISTCGCISSTESEPKTNQPKETISTTAAVSTKTPGTDIHSAVILNNIEAIKQHILAGSDINEKDPFGGSSPLISAALFDKEDIVEILLDAGAELNFQNNDGSTALHTAAFFCRPKIVQLLLDSGANKSIKNNNGNSAYDMVTGPFEEVKPIYDILGQTLAPFGLILDYEYLKTTRPKIMALLK